MRRLASSSIRTRTQTTMPRHRPMAVLLFLVLLMTVYQLAFFSFDDTSTMTLDPHMRARSTRGISSVAHAGRSHNPAPNTTLIGDKDKNNTLSPSTSTPTSTTTSNQHAIRLVNHDRPSSPISPTQLHQKFAHERYSNKIPFVQGYKPTGGPLPLDAADFLSDPKQWKYVDNHTCLFPEQKIPEWQTRAPYMILLGAMKCGTHAVTRALWEHPRIRKTGYWELHFFDGPRVIRTDQGIDQTRTREHYRQAFDKSIPDFPKNDTSSMIAFESSPRYLLNSDRIPDLMFCVAPWAKLMAILRNPVDRVGSHYRYLDDSRRKSDQPMVDWDTWIQDDLRLMTQANLFNATTPQEEWLAWKTYQRRPSSYQIVGRGLYVLQLEHYLQAMDRWNKSRSDLLVLQSEAFRQDTQHEYDRILDFLHLPPHTLHNLTEEHVTTHTSTPMPSQIRRQLQELYAPYNQRLYKLLGWDKVWD